MKVLYILLICVSFLFSFEKIGHFSDESYSMMEDMLMSDDDKTLYVKTDIGESDNYYILNVFDVNNTSNITLKKTYDFGLSVDTFKIIDDRLYITMGSTYDNNTRFLIYDLANDQNISSIATVTNSNDIDIIRNNTLAIISLIGTTHDVFDISDEQNIIDKQNINFGGSDINTTINDKITLTSEDENILFMLSKSTQWFGDEISYHLHTLDITDINSPVILDSINGKPDAMNYNTSQVMIDNKLYVSNASSTYIHVFDISNPSDIKLEKKINLNVSQSKIVLTNDKKQLLFFYRTVGGTPLQDDYDASKTSIVRYDIKSDKIVDYDEIDNGIFSGDIILSNDGEKLFLTSRNGLDVFNIYDKDIVLNNSWSLLGATKDLDLNATFDDAKVIWKYENNSWKVYSGREDIKALAQTNYELTDNVKQGGGYWVYNDTNVSKRYTKISTVIDGISVVDSNLNFNLLSTQQIVSGYAKQDVLSYLYVIYRDAVNNRLKFAVNESLSNKWKISDIPGTQDCTKVSAIYSPGADTLFVIYNNADSKLTFRTTYDMGETWNDPTIIDNGVINIDGMITDISEAQSGVLAVAYHSHSDLKLNFAISDNMGAYSWNVLRDLTDIGHEESGYFASITSSSSVVAMAHTALNDQKKMIVTAGSIDYNSVYSDDFSDNVIEDKSSATGQIFSYPSIKSQGINSYLIYVDNDSLELKFAKSDFYGLSSWGVPSVIIQSNALQYPASLTIKDQKLIVSFVENDIVKLAISDDEGETWSIKVVGDSYIGLSHYKFNGFINDAENCYELYYLNRSGDLARYVMKL